MTSKKCFCTATLRPDGTCTHGCKQEHRRPGARAARVRSLQRQRTREVTKNGAFLTAKEAREGIIKALPPRARYAGCEDFMARVNK